MTPAGIEQATFRFVAQYLSHCATAVPHSLGLTPILFYHLHLNFQTGLFISDFHCKIYGCISCYSVRAVCSINLRFLDVTLIANRPDMKVLIFRSFTLAHTALPDTEGASAGTVRGGYFARDKRELG